MKNGKKFSEYLFDEYANWMKGKRERKTFTDFAIEVGVSTQTIARLIEKDTDKTPNLRTIKALAKVIGDDIYNFLDISEEDIELRLIKQSWRYIPKEDKQKVFEIVAPYIELAESQPRGRKKKTSI